MNSQGNPPNPARHGVHALLRASAFVCALAVVLFAVSFRFVPVAPAYWLTAALLATVTFTLAWWGWRTRFPAILIVLPLFLAGHSIAQRRVLPTGAPEEMADLIYGLQFLSVCSFIYFVLLRLFRSQILASLEQQAAA